MRRGGTEAKSLAMSRFATRVAGSRDARDPQYVEFSLFFKLRGGLPRPPCAGPSFACMSIGRVRLVPRVGPPDDRATRWRRSAMSKVVGTVGALLLVFVMERACAEEIQVTMK